jgi:hypothetical protein
LSDGRLLIRDNIKGSFTKAVTRFYFHPEVKVVEANTSGMGRLLLPEGEEIMWCVKGGCQSVVAGTYHPEFGLSIPNRCLEVLMDGNDCKVEFTWSTDELISPAPAQQGDL